jgi:hypothetical protein
MRNIGEEEEPHDCLTQKARIHLTHMEEYTEQERYVILHNDYLKHTTVQ